MDLNGVEQINFNALGGADNITVDDLSGTDVKQVEHRPGAASGSGAGDGEADTVTVNGTGGSDQIQIVGNGQVRSLSTGLPAQVTITGAEGVNDHADASMAAAATTPINAAGLAGRRRRARPSMAAPATTPSSAAPAPTR